MFIHIYIYIYIYIYRERERERDSIHITTPRRRRQSSITWGRVADLGVLLGICSQCVIGPLKGNAFIFKHAASCSRATLYSFDSMSDADSPPFDAGF